jgi:hypothetical protein
MEFRDPIIKQVVEKFVSRSNVGFEKYGVTLQDDKSDLDTWLNHLQEELMDAVNYIEKLRTTMKTQKIKPSGKNVGITDSIFKSNNTWQ